MYKSPAHLWCGNKGKKWTHNVPESPLHYSSFIVVKAILVKGEAGLSSGWGTSLGLRTPRFSSVVNPRLLMWPWKSHIW